MRKYRPKKNVWPYDGVLLIAMTFVILHHFEINRMPFLDLKIWMYAAVFIMFIREFSALNIDLKKEYLNPAQLFIISFIALILLGTALLSLPKATYTGISFVDALFTSTSAVCVTGLIVVDTSTYFTTFGQTVILILIQLGGLGIMTFTSYFSYFFRGATTYENQLLLKDMTNSDKIAEVFSTLKKIILLTIVIETIGAFIISTNLNYGDFESTAEQIYFSVFHSISAFCNAGFSTMSNGLYEEAYRFNYPMQLIIAFLFIIGGIGFPLLFNFFKYLKHLFIQTFIPKSWRKREVYVPGIININTRLVLITTTLFLVGGTIFFYLFEYNNTLQEHGWFGKIVTAFFGAATPRTAGFNTVDFGALNFSTILMVFLLMWVGASPASTGGGIKTSTFAVATLNLVSLARGKDRIELYRREVADISVRRAFATISLSFVVIGFAVFFLTWTDGDKDLTAILFESISAFGTVGVTMGITGDLSTAGKFVVITTMFIGRVSMLTILIALIRKVAHTKYRYPTEEILIN